MLKYINESSFVKSSLGLFCFLIVRIHRIILLHHATYKVSEFILVDFSVFISIELVKHCLNIFVIGLLCPYIFLTNLLEEYFCLSEVEKSIFVSIIRTEYFSYGLFSGLFFWGLEWMMVTEVSAFVVKALVLLLCKKDRSFFLHY